MKIGILTYHCVPNFGAQLQTVSTIGYLKNLGHEPVVIHWYPQDLENMYSKRIPAEQVQMHIQFAENNMPLSKLCRTEDDVINEIERLHIDAVFAGSDALFKYVPESRRTFFSKRRLRFVKRNVMSVENLDGNVFQGGFLGKVNYPIKGVAFSVSSQNCPFMELNGKERQTIKSAMNHYVKISTRDKWTRDMVQFITGRTDVDITPDPVFAYNQNCYLDMPTREEILSKYSIPEKYVLISFWTKYLNDVYIHGLAKELECNGLTPVVFPMPEHLLDYGLKYKVNLPLSPLDWYALIKYSQGYIGERMHPIVVCLHNAIPFFCFDEYGTFKKSLFGLRKKYIPSSSKTFHILEKAGLTEWMYSYFDENTILLNYEAVVQKFLNFPVSKCKVFSERIKDKYNKSMMNMLKYLNE